MRRLFSRSPDESFQVTTGEWLLNRLGMIARMTAHPGRRDALVECLLDLARLAGKAAGCYVYLVHTGTTGSDEVWLVEAWRSKVQHDLWLARPEVQDLIASASELVANASEPIFTEPVGGKGLSSRLAVA